MVGSSQRTACINLGQEALCSRGPGTRSAPPGNPGRRPVTLTPPRAPDPPRPPTLVRVQPQGRARPWRAGPAPPLNAPRPGRAGPAPGRPAPPPSARHRPGPGALSSRARALPASPAPRRPRPAAQRPAAASSQRHLFPRWGRERAGRESGPPSSGVGLPRRVQDCLLTHLAALIRTPAKRGGALSRGQRSPVLATDRSFPSPAHTHCPQE